MTLRHENTNYVNSNDLIVAEWVPASVRKRTRNPNVDVEERTARLLNDPRMKAVWARLSKKKLIDPAIIDTGYFAPVKRLLESEAFAAGDAAALVFFESIDRLFGSPLPLNKVALEEMLTPWRAGLKLMREIEASPAAMFDPELAGAARIVREHIERQGKSYKKNLQAFVVDRQSNERGKKDETRVLGRRVAEVMKGLFGSPLYKLAATVTAVLTVEDVTRKDIENWTRS